RGPPVPPFPTRRSSDLPVGAVASPPMSALVTVVARDSDNYVAETLTKAIAARTTIPATTADGAAAITTAAAGIGSQVALVDGSEIGRDTSELQSRFDLV